MALDYRIIEKGLWVGFEAHIKKGYLTPDFSVFSPELTSAREELMSILNKRGWVDKSKEPIFKIIPFQDIQHLFDGSSLYYYMVKPDTPTDCYQ